MGHVEENPVVCLPLLETSSSESTKLRRLAWFLCFKSSHFLHEVRSCVVLHSVPYNMFRWQWQCDAESITEELKDELSEAVRENPELIGGDSKISG